MNYESSDDIAREDAVASAFATSWKCEAIRNRPFYVIDRTLIRDGVIKGWMEIKCRTKEYDSVFLSLNKWLTGRQYARETGCPFIAAYGLPTGIWYFTTHGTEKFDFHLKVTGRKDRSNPNDVHPAVEIPLSYMKKLRTNDLRAAA